MVQKNQFLLNMRFALRDYTVELDPSKNRLNVPLLIIDPQRIIPTPLHVFLGIGNRIIKKCYKQLYENETVDAVTSTIKTKRPVSNIGAGAVHELNGPELARWTKEKCGERMHAATADENKDDGTYITLDEWIADLYKYLLSKDEWSEDDKQMWRKVVDQILGDWIGVTGDNAFPKLHMLTHTVETIERFGFLSRLDEQPIEAAHCEINRLHNHNHRNKSQVMQHAPLHAWLAPLTTTKHKQCISEHSDK
jgi:hypothetical protein